MTFERMKYLKQNSIEENIKPLRKFKAICKKELIIHTIVQFYQEYLQGEIYPCNISEHSFITIVRVFNQNEKYSVCIEMDKNSFYEYFSEIIE